MLKIIKKGKLLTYVDVYFADNRENTVDIKSDIVCYQNLYELHDTHNLYSVGYSMISDLSKSKEELWQKLHKSTKYDIHRSERYCIEYCEFNSKDIKEQKGFDWESFSQMYEKMFFDKNLPRKIDKNEFNSIILCGGGT